MSKKKIENLISPKLDRTIKVKYFLVDYYLKRGYFRYPKNYILCLLLKFYIHNLRKFKFFLYIIFNIKIIFKDFPKNNILIYDCVNTSDLRKVLRNKKYGVLTSRLARLKEIYLSKKIILFMIKNYLKRSLKQNYLAALIHLASPKVVITNVDNEDDFHITSKIFEKSKIKFIAVQCANRGDTVWKDLKHTSKIFIPEFLCFSSFDKKIHKWKKCKIKKYYPIGSLRASNAISYLKFNKFHKKKDLYDICLISEFLPNADGDWQHVENFHDKVGQIANYTYRLSEEMRLKVIFSSKTKGELVTAEKIFYKNYIKNYKFKISRYNKNKFSTYVNMQRSKMIIGLCSTTLREAFLLKKKVLACNFTGHKDIIFPSKGICLFNKDTSYVEFKKRVLKILSMSFNEYKKNLSTDINNIMDTRTDPAVYIKKRVEQIIN